MLIANELVQSWAAQPGLWQKTLSWSWFKKAFHDGVQADSAAPGQTIDETSLSKAFFEWAASVEFYQPYEKLDAVDFRHFMAGLLLQKLMSAQPPAVGPAAGASTAVTGFVLNLLQALRLEMGAPAYALDADCVSGMHWSSFVENVREDASTAVCFLDQMTGLQPVWQSPTLIESRPAMQKALGRAPASP